MAIAPSYHVMPPLGRRSGPLLAQCGHLHGSSDFKDKGGREENGWIGEKGEDILGEKRLGSGERRQKWAGACMKEDTFRPHARIPKFWSPCKQLMIKPIFDVGWLKQPMRKIVFFVSVD
jgi:hypothetical protein